MPQISKQCPQMSAYQSPRPTPKFFDAAQTFSTKKARATPKSKCPPRPPIKSCPPISRLFPHRPVQQKALPVSFKNPCPTLDNPFYNENKRELYFEQCFHIICKLGSGSFGDVFKVQSKEDNKYYAIKRSRERFKGTTDRERKLEEVRKHEELPSHPNCIEFIRAWEERQHLYIQTELCDMSLKHYADVHHDIPETLVWKYLLDLAMAIKHLHDHDLIHLDIKPANIFISSTGTCKLGDFGLVVKNHQGELVDAQEGDPKYLAAELMVGVFTKAADIFSLGITILELATDLDLPVGGPRWHELRQGNIPHEFVHHLSVELVDLIREMMHPDASRRPTADQLLSQATLHMVVKWKRLEKFCNVLVASTTMVCSWIMALLWSMMMIFLYPFKRLLSATSLPSQLSLSTPQSLATTHDVHTNSLPRLSSTQWESSFSDEDDDPLNLSALCKPLFNSSPRSSPQIKFNSTPIRNGRSNTTSPFLNWDSSDGISGSPSLQPKLKFSRVISFNDDAEDDMASTCIGPKNLMSLFDAESDSEEN